MCVMCSCHMILLGSSMHQTLCLVCSVAKQFGPPQKLCPNVMKWTVNRVKLEVYYLGTKYVALLE